MVSWEMLGCLLIASFGVLMEKNILARTEPKLDHVLGEKKARLYETNDYTGNLWVRVCAYKPMQQTPIKCMIVLCYMYTDLDRIWGTLGFSKVLKCTVSEVVALTVFQIGLWWCKSQSILERVLLSCDWVSTSIITLILVYDQFMHEQHVEFKQLWCTVSFSSTYLAGSILRLLT